MKKVQAKFNQGHLERESIPGSSVQIRHLELELGTLAKELGIFAGTETGVSFHFYLEQDLEPGPDFFITILLQPFCYESAVVLLRCIRI